MSQTPSTEEQEPPTTAKPPDGTGGLSLQNLREQTETTVRHKPTSLWLDAWMDPVANCSAFSPCIATADLAGDSDWRLLVANSDKKLKVWKGTSLLAEHKLLDEPVAMSPFYSDGDQFKLPALAIAAGPHVYIYRNLRPYYKFTVPNLEIDAKELEVWEQLRAGKSSVADAFETLANMRDSGVMLTSRSMDFLSIEEGHDELQRQEAFVNAHVKAPLVQQTTITCMSSLRKNIDEWDAVSSLYLGTEAGQIYVLEPSGTAVHSKFTIPSPPVFVASTGLLDIDYRIVVASRNGHIYTIKNGELTGVVIELESQPCGLVRTSKNILVGCMNNVVHNFHVKGKKNYSLYLPAPIVCMEALNVVRARMVKCLIVSLSNGELRVYNEKHLVSIYHMADTVQGMHFGRFGREDNVLTCTTASGSLQVKILPRQADLEISSQHTGPPPEQDIPLQVPKKTKLYVEQTQREREQAVDMHRIFQRDLCKLRLSTARAYVKVLTDGQGPMSYSSSSSVRLNAQVQGLGPLFKIRLNVQNTGQKVLYNIPIMLSAASMYSLSRSQVLLPLLIPGLVYLDEVEVTCNDQNGGADTVKVYVCNKNSALPILSAVVKMPLSEFLEE